MQQIKACCLQRPIGLHPFSDWGSAGSHHCTSVSCLAVLCLAVIHLLQLRLTVCTSGTWPHDVPDLFCRKALGVQLQKLGLQAVAAALK